MSHLCPITRLIRLPHDLLPENIEYFNMNGEKGVAFNNYYLIFYYSKLSGQDAGGRRLTKVCTANC